MKKPEDETRANAVRSPALCPYFSTAVCLKMHMGSAFIVWLAAKGKKPGPSRTQTTQIREPETARLTPRGRKIRKKSARSYLEKYQLERYFVYDNLLPLNLYNKGHIRIIINAGSAARRGNSASTGSDDADPAPNPDVAHAPGAALGQAVGGVLSVVPDQRHECVRQDHVSRQPEDVLLLRRKYSTCLRQLFLVRIDAKLCTKPTPISGGKRKQSEVFSIFEARLKLYSSIYTLHTAVRGHKTSYGPGSQVKFSAWLSDAISRNLPFPVVRKI